MYSRSVFCMDTKVLLFLFIVSSCWGCNARDFTVLQLNDKLIEGDAQHVQELSKNDNLCSLCEQFASEALVYFSQNKTQTEIISTLHKSCSKIPSFEKQCIILVDYYAPLFFIEVETIEPKEFCKKAALCKADVSVFQLPSQDNKCDICHNVVSEALLKLKDPDTELEIVQMLLKACDSIGKTVKKCKRLVFEYAPLVLVNAEQFLETNDVCTILHACDDSAAHSSDEILVAAS